MDVVILGAGTLGVYLASILSNEQHNVILIDSDNRKLEKASANIDVGMKHGNATDWQLLDELNELRPDLLIASTNCDETNIIACTIAKNLGYPKTIALIEDGNYFNRTRLDFERMFNVDHFVGPEIIVAQDIFKSISAPGAISVESFAHGSVQMRTLIVPEKWRHTDTQLSDLKLLEGIMIGLIARWGGHKNSERQLIFPHGTDCLLPGDEVTFIGETEDVLELNLFFGLGSKKVENVTLFGGSLTALNLAKVLEQHEIGVRIIEKDYEQCCALANKLPGSAIIHHDGLDIDFLKAEKVGSTDFFVAATNRDQANLLASVLARDVGCHHIMALISDTRLLPMIKKMGIEHTLSPKMSAANRVLSIARMETVASMVSLYDQGAEVMEVRISRDSKFVGIPLKDLGPKFPKDFLICVIQNRGRIMIAHGGSILSPGDTIIVMSSPKHIHELHKVF